MSIPEVVTVTRHARASGAPLLIELPHGATRTEDYRTLRSRLRGSYADDLVDFFHVNTDVGSPELADAIARQMRRPVIVIQSRIPRTFVDCNRVIDAAPEAFREGKVTPGVPPWVRDPEDLALLRGLHAQYVDVTTRLVDEVCGAGGAALMLHTYAPRSVDVEVDEQIVANLRRAYAPDRRDTWPLRPEVDIIGRSLSGELLVDAGFLADLTAKYAAIGADVADGRTYPMHPSTWAYHHGARWPGRTVCVEIRRDLIADPWDPFAEMRMGAGVERMAGPLAAALEGWMGSPSR